MTDRRGQPKGGPRPKVRTDDRRGGNKPYVFTDAERDQVREWARFMTARQIGLALRGPEHPISANTILRQFEAEFAYGRAHLIMEVGGKMVDAALAGDTKVGLQFLKWFGDPGQFVDRRELTGAGGGPIQVADLAALANLDESKLNDLERVASILAGLVGESAGGPEAVSDEAGPDSAGDGAPPQGA